MCKLNQLESVDETKRETDLKRQESRNIPTKKGVEIELVYSGGGFPKGLVRCVSSVEGNGSSVAGRQKRCQQ